MSSQMHTGGSSSGYMHTCCTFPPTLSVTHLHPASQGYKQSGVSAGSLPGKEALIVNTLHPRAALSPLSGCRIPSPTLSCSFLQLNFQNYSDLHYTHPNLQEPPSPGNLKQPTFDQSSCRVNFQGNINSFCSLI